MSVLADELRSQTRPVDTVGPPGAEELLTELSPEGDVRHELPHRGRRRLDVDLDHMEAVLFLWKRKRKL